MSLDLALFQLIHRFAGMFSLVDWSAVVIAQYLPYGAALLVLVLIMHEKRWRDRVYALLALAFALLLAKGLVVEAIQFFYNRPRPFLALGLTPLFPEASPAFPSSHAAVLFTLACFAFTLNKKSGYWLFAFALVNGIARIYSGVHWPLDVLGGAVVACACFWVASKAFPKQASMAPETPVAPEETPVS